jgi:hypothetical protein
MAQFCLQCGVQADDSKRFCGCCGRPLVPAAEAEAQLQRDLHDAPEDLHVIGQLVHLLEVDETRAPELAELRLRWCEALLMSHPGGQQLEDVRAEFSSIPKELLPPAALERAVGCLTELYADEGVSGRLAEEAALLFRDVRGRLTDSATRAWIQACLAWGDAERERRPRSARTFYQYALEADPTDSEVSRRLERLLERLRVRKLLAMAGAVASILLVVGVLLAVRHFTISELKLAAPEGFQDATVCVLNGRGQSQTLRTTRPGVHEGTMSMGRYVVRVSKEGFAAWDTMLVIHGAQNVSLALPVLDLSAEAKLAIDRAARAQREAEQARREAMERAEEAERAEQARERQYWGLWSSGVRVSWGGQVGYRSVSVSLSDVRLHATCGKVFWGGCDGPIYLLEKLSPDKLHFSYKRPCGGSGEFQITRRSNREVYYEELVNGRAAGVGVLTGGH